MSKIKANPYQKEIIATYILAPILMLIETWRRWDNLFSMSYFDDVILVILAGIAVYYLRQQKFIGQLLWLFAAGAFFMLINISFFWAVEEMHLPDASGIAMVNVLAVKVLMYLIVLLMCWRAFQLLLRTKFETS